MNLSQTSLFPEPLRDSIRAQLQRAEYRVAHPDSECAAADSKHANVSSALHGLSIYGFQSVSSTMDVANAYVQQSLSEGDLEKFLIGTTRSSFDSWFAFVALSQTKGRGRKQRYWLSREGQGIYVTFLFYTTKPQSELAGLSLVIGLGIQAAVRSLGGDCQLKWPNDVLASFLSSSQSMKPHPSTEENQRTYRKLAGVLVDVSASRVLASQRAIQVGVGVNLFRQDFPGDVPGISLQECVERAPSYSEAFIALIASIREEVSSFLDKGFAPFAERWNKQSGQVGSLVEVEGADGQRVAGQILGVAADGGLIIQAESGQSVIYSGELHRI